MLTTQNEMQPTKNFSYIITDCKWDSSI